MSFKRKIIPVYIALGTNLGDRVANLQAAIHLMPPLVKVVELSPIYQTAPWGYEEQPDFLNQVILAETKITPVDLLNHLKGIEIQVGRTPTFRYGPRVVDLDILFYGDQVLDLAELQIPHPKIQERAFVLIPLNDLSPDLRHPTLSITVRKMLLQVSKIDVTPFTP